MIKKGTKLKSYNRRPPPRELRFGIALPVMKALLVDAIERFGDRGASLQDLHRAMYPGDANVRQAHSLDTIKTHISAINEAFAECHMRIRCSGGRYRIVHVKGEAA